MSPLTRFLLMIAIWLGLVAAGEVLATRRGRAGDVASPVVGALRLLAAASFGAVVFQAAQSLQVPAYEPVLVGVWAAGALLLAYAVRGVAPLVLGVVLLAFWFVWEVTSSSESAFAASTALATAGLAAAAIGVGHVVLGRRSFAAPWRELGAVLVLVGLFVAALPYAWGDAEGTWALCPSNWRRHRIRLSHRAAAAPPGSSSPPQRGSGRGGGRGGHLPQRPDGTRRYPGPQRHRGSPAGFAGRDDGRDHSSL